MKSFLSILLLTISLSSSAEHGRGHLETGRRWHGGDIHHFEVHDRIYWRGGHWRHARYGGRFGWWWVVGPSWYFYSHPIYPYPDPYIPPSVVVPAQSPPVQYWYYCESVKEYYPYTPSCPEGWKAIPATPAQPAK